MTEYADLVQNDENRPHRFGKVVHTNNNGEKFAMCQRNVLRCFLVKQNLFDIIFVIRTDSVGKGPKALILSRVAAVVKCYVFDLKDEFNPLSVCRKDRTNWIDHLSCVSSI